MAQRNNVQGKYWILTIPQHEFTPYQPRGVDYIGGQLEAGSGTGYLHWQIIVCFERKIRLRGVKTCFGPSCHAELTKSDAARQYCFKDDTSIAGTRFELGVYPFRRNKKPDWESIWEHAKKGEFEACPANIRITSYRSLCAIAKDNLRPTAMERTVWCFWGPTGTGKSHRAWEEAGYDAYPKIASTKFWDGYQGVAHVVIDEFTGQIAIEHLLRWFDRYPVNVEVKGSCVALKATKFWLTSNVNPRDWYPGCNPDQLAALMRRMNVIQFLNNELQ